MLASESATDSNTKIPQNLSDVWTKENFNNKTAVGQKPQSRNALNLELNLVKTSWAVEGNRTSDGVDKDETLEMETKEDLSPTAMTPEKESPTTPSHHARRPMNAFLIFCKKHRPVVRQRFPHLENRGVTRILGEWWALLAAEEKNCYTNLAKEYKDAFFSANPDFKWYKLPAPPLRSATTTAATRPTTFPKPFSPTTFASPHTTPTSADFTPGKLADETQLGNLTSLMNCASNNNKETPEELTPNNLEESPVNTNESDNAVPPPKPLNKRSIEQLEEDGENNNQTSEVVIDIFNAKDGEIENFGPLDQNENVNQNGCKDNMTKQELVDKVVDSMFPEDSLPVRKNGFKSKEVRKSRRACKGRRYAEFMIEGKLLGTKQSRKFTPYRFEIGGKFENDLNSKIDSMMHVKPDSAKINLGDTIKRLAERTNTKLEDIYGEDHTDAREDASAKDNDNVRQRIESENSDDFLMKIHNDFNLDSRIAELPSLSYETFIKRKKESKKRKHIRAKSESSSAGVEKSEDSMPVGSKKRKNKNSITRLEKPTVVSMCAEKFNQDLFGLATLAEVAANTEKIN